MRSRVSSCGFCLVAGGLVVACGTELAQTAEAPPIAATGTGTARAGDGGSSPPSSARDCGGPLLGLLTVTRIGVDTDIRYKRPGYNLVPEDERIAFSVDLDGAAKVAWLDSAGTRVHVTSLDPGLARNGTDTVVDGVDVGGLVAARDGFALLTRRTDPGTPLPDPAAGDSIGKAAVFVRVRAGTPEIASPLTGTASVTSAALGAARDCATSPLHGRLEWNGSKYGAYFAMHGCDGDSHAPFFGDKLAYLDDEGRALAGGFGWNCSIDEGLRLLPERDVFTSLCLSDGTPFPGLDLVVAGRAPVELAPEMSATGYSAGQFGSIAKMGDGTYVVGWLSRGTTGSPDRPQAAKRAPDIALVRLGGGGDYTPLGPLTWLLETEDVAEANLHLAPYGQNRLLVIWDAIEKLRCGPQTCFGEYAGTHARLIDAHGNFLSPDTLVPAVPNTNEDLEIFPNGDLGWAFVAEDSRSYADPLVTGDGGATPAVPPSRTLSVARLAYCP